MAVQLPQRTQGANPSGTLARIAGRGGGEMSFPQQQGGGNQGQGLAAGIAGAGQSVGSAMSDSADRGLQVAMHKDSQRFAKEQQAEQYRMATAMGLINFAHTELVNQRHAVVDHSIKYLEYAMAHPDLISPESIKGVEALIMENQGPPTWRQMLNPAMMISKQMGIPLAGFSGDADMGGTGDPLLSASTSSAGGLGLTDDELDRPVIGDISRMSKATLLATLVPGLTGVADERTKMELGKKIAKVGAIQAVQAKDLEHQVEALLLGEGGEITPPDPESGLASALQGANAGLSLGGIRFTRREEGIRRAVSNLKDMAAKGELPPDLTEYIAAAVNPVRDTGFAQLQRLALSGDPEWINMEMAGPSSAVAMASIFDNTASTLMDMIEGGVDETGQPVQSLIDAELGDADPEMRGKVAGAIKNAAQQYRNAYYRVSSSWHAYKFPAAQALNDYRDEVAYKSLTPGQQSTLFDEKMSPFMGDEGYQRFVNGNAATTFTKLMQRGGPEAFRGYINPDYLQKYDQWALDRTSFPQYPKPGQQQQQTQPQQPQGVMQQIGQSTPKQIGQGVSRAASMVGQGAKKAIGQEMQAGKDLVNNAINTPIQEMPGAVSSWLTKPYDDAAWKQQQEEEFAAWGVK